MKEEDELVKRLNFENFIWLIFIIISLSDIYGDELIKKSILKNDLEAKQKSENLFLIISLISILIYIYFFYRNYTDYEKYKNKLYATRLFASILILGGTLLLLYFQLNVNNEDDLSSNV